MSEKQPPSVPSTIFGSYRLTGILGRGGMGIVYRAEHISTHQEVALKTLHTMEATVLGQMRREIASLARLAHPGVVRILAHGVHEGAPWYAMELLKGLTLNQLCKIARFDTGSITIKQTEGPSFGSSTKATSNIVGATQSSGMATHTPGAETSHLEGEDTQTNALNKEQLFAASMGKQDTKDTIQVHKLPFPRKKARALLTLLRRLCAPLAYLHGEGVVHRDLKPGNLLFIEDGRPVVVDFGLSADLGGQSHRERLMDDDQTFGTPGYMAPEQILGKAVDARSDLYSLGCIMFKVLTGRVPFIGKGPAQVYQQHLKKPPPHFSDFFEDVPKGLQHLLDKLLAKSPDDRLGYAMDVAARLVGLGADDEPLPGPTPRPYLYQPGFVGRTAPVETLLAKIQRPDSPLLFLEGESGVGRTRVLVEVLQKARAKGFHVFSGKSQPPSQVHPGATAHQEPLSALRKPLRMLADQCWERGAKETMRIFGTHRLQVLASFEPILRQIPGGNTDAPETLPPVDAQRRLLDALVHSFVAAGTPTLLVLDDMQWVDPLTCHILQMYAQDQHLHERSSLRILLSFRSKEAPEELATLAQEQTRVTLDRLDVDGIRAMIHNMLAVHKAPELFVQGVYRYSQGNPFFAAEYLRMALAQGYLQRNQQGAWQFSGLSERAEDGFTLPLPPSIQQLLIQRLEGLAPDELTLLEWASVWAQPFDEEILLACEVGEAALHQVLTLLCQRHVLEQATSSTFQLTHEPLREAIYESLSAPRRKALHKTIAEALTHKGPEMARWSWTASEVARHWHKADQLHEARQAYLQAANEAVARSSLHEAQTLYTLHIELAKGSDDMLLQAKLALAAKVHFPLGQFSPARALLEELLALAAAEEQPALLARAQMNLGFVLHAQGQIDAATTLLEASLDYYTAHEELEGKARALRYIGVIHAQRGQFDEAVALFGRSLAIWDKLGHMPEQGLLLNNLGSVYFEQNQNAYAENYFTQALKLFQQGEHHTVQGKLLNNLSIVSLEQGKYAQSERFGERSLSIRRALGDRVGEGFVMNNLAFLAYRQRDYAKAHAISMDAKALWESVQHPRGEGYLLVNLGAICRDTGDFGGAMDYFAQSLTIAEQLQNPHLEGHIHLYRATSYRYQNEGALAKAAAEQALATFTAEHKGKHLPCIAELGFLRLASGQSAHDLLARAEAIVSEGPSTTGGELFETIEAFRKASQAHEAGEALHFGQRPEDLPPLLRGTLSLSHTPKLT